MKLIIAYVQPFMLDKVIDMLRLTACVSGATVTDVRGFGRGRPNSVEEQVCGGSTRSRIEIAANDDCVEQIVQKIRAAAHTGNRGDGKILILPLERTLRIQTEEEGVGALE